MPHDNFTYNHLPYGEYAQSAYDGIQNIYGKTLDNAYDSVGNFFRPERAQEIDPNAGTIFSKEAIENRAEWNNADEFPNSLKMAPPRDYTEYEMGSSPYQETDTGPGLMMSGGPMSRNGYRHHPEGNIPANANFRYEPYYADDDYDNLKAMQFDSNIREPEGAPVKFTSKSFEQEMMDANNGVPMTRQDFAEYNNARFEEPQKTQRPQSDWAKWKASMKPQER